MRKLVGLSDSLMKDRGSSVVALVLAVTFSLMMLPVWIVTLAHPDPGWQAVLMVVGALYGLACVAAVPLTSGRGRSARWGACAVVLGLGLLLVALVGVRNSALLVCALCIVAALMSAQVTGALTAVTVGGLMLIAWPSGQLAGQFENIVILVSVTTAAVLTVRLANAYTELKAARDQIAMFAVAKERERFARDLHDILGHSLTTITLKAGVVRRMLETGDADRSLTEIRDLERLGRQALTDVRATVSEYRDVTLTGELAAASETLRSADIRADLPHAVDNVEPELQQVFGYVLREAITNVVRHSEAREVSVRLERNSIKISDNGVGAGTNSEGNGLAGLSERIRAVNGVLSTGPAPGGGFVLRASAPVVAKTASTTHDSPLEGRT